MHSRIGINNTWYIEPEGSAKGVVAGNTGFDTNMINYGLS